MVYPSPRQSPHPQPLYPKGRGEKDGPLSPKS
jgi:hypothetical protein